MDIRFENPNTATLFQAAFDQLTLNVKDLLIVSTDKEDLGKIHRIPIKDITSIEEDCEGICIWWRFHNGFKWLDSSAHSETFKFV